MKKMNSDAFRNVPVAGTLLGVVAIAALALAYWGNVSNREKYLQSRNFRLLGDVAEQTQAMLYDSEQMIRGNILTTLVALKEAKSKEQPNWDPPLSEDVSLEWARAAVPQRRRGESRDGQGEEQAADRRVAGIELGSGKVTFESSPAPVSEVAKQFKEYRMALAGEGTNLRFEWTTAGDARKRLPKVSFELPADALLAGAFNEARWNRAFSTMALATTDGRVVFAVGAQAAELKASGVTSLLPVATPGPVANLVRFGSAIADDPVRIAGTDYRMYTQPCCRSSNATAAVNSSPSGLVVIGLADEDAMRSLSLAISPLLVLAGAAFVMACLVAWTFLKCSLMGVQQRLRRHDVISLLASGLLGVALGTIVLLTIGAYARISADVDAQLRHLAHTVGARFTDEIETAALKLQTMTRIVGSDVCSGTSDTPVSPPSAGQVPNDPCQKVVAPLADPNRRDFLTFAMVDGSGLQAAKAAFTASTGNVVDVSTRDYYQRALARKQLWALPLPNKSALLKPGETIELCPAGCYVGSVSAWTTGKPQVVMSMPTEITRLPVAALSIQMHALLAPVLPLGFEFAVIDSDGIVQFHSDWQRNGQENLLLETDQNARLRSLAASRSAGTFTTMYWGYPYRGYIEPARIPGWSIVVFHSKQAARALVVEWFTVAMLLAGLYTVGWVVVMMLSLRRGAAWLWPDPLRRHWYVPLGCLAAAATALWLGIAVWSSVTVTAIAGVTIPILIWVVVYIVLAVRPAGAGEVRQWTEMCRSYRFAGTAIFLLTAAVPAASFYALSFDRHVEAFFKERQIALAARMNQAAECDAEKKLNGQVLSYYDDDHDGAVTCVASTTPVEEPAFDRYLHEAFEDSIPYFTSASIALRELMHKNSDDGSWFSHRGAPPQMALQLRSRHPGYWVQVTSTLPATTALKGTGPEAHIVVVAAVALLLLTAIVAAAYFVIAFLLQRVLLADVVEPVRRRHRIVTQVGQHLQVICGAPAWMASHVYDLLVVRLNAGPTGAGARTLAEIMSEVSDAPASQRIAIADLDEPLGDGPLLEKKLEIVEALMDLPNQTVLLFTTRKAANLDASIREQCASSPDRDRWSRLVARLRVTEFPAQSETTASERWAHYFRNLLQGWRDEFLLRWQDWNAPLRWRARLLEREGQSDPKVDEIATELQNSAAFVSGSLTRDQILEEIEEAAEEHYREIWNARSDDERVLLEHVARHGLASAASRRVVRKLLSTGLLRKDPELRLMSESFQRFVLEPERSREVAALEKQAAASLWDRLRVPLAMSGMLALLFLIVTQREALDSTMSMAIGVTTAVPTLVKLATMLAQLGAKGESKENA